MHRAIRHAALRAARCLLGGFGGRVAARDLGKVLGAQFGVALRRERLGGADKFEHWVFGHDAILRSNADAILRMFAKVTRKAYK